MKLLHIALLAASVSAGAPSVFAAEPDKGAVLDAITTYLPGTTGFGRLRVDSIDVNARKRTVTVFCNEATSYLPLTKQSAAALKSDVTAALGSEFAKYKVQIKSAGKDLDDLALFASKAPRAPREKERFVTDRQAQPAPKGLDGANIALWQSHGWYFEPKLNRWEWQRARIFQTVEDLYTQSYVMPFLMPMLRNAGAYVMSPRERDTNTTEIIVDADGGQAYDGYSDDDAVWTTAEANGFAYKNPTLRNGDNPFRAGTARMARTVRKPDQATSATWSADIPAPDDYAVY
ncbi:MAG: xanthan lyase, partial [Muribaculaceae bacterium]|nr:xanthan lyase [Muribaculaceae bacterium]